MWLVHTAAVRNDSYCPYCSENPKKINDASHVANVRANCEQFVGGAAGDDAVAEAVHPMSSRPSFVPLAHRLRSLLANLVSGSPK